MNAAAESPSVAKLLTVMFESGSLSRTIGGVQCTEACVAGLQAYSVWSCGHDTSHRNTGGSWSPHTRPPELVTSGGNSAGQSSTHLLATASRYSLTATPLISVAQLVQEVGWLTRHVAQVESQSMQAGWPRLIWNWLGAHSMHRVWPGSGWKCPVGHGSHWPVLAARNDPAAQGEQPADGSVGSVRTWPT